MAEEREEAITAICDVAQEGFIAGTLHRMGWSVLYRATSPEGLMSALERFPSALLISSEDFIVECDLRARKSVIIATHNRSKNSGRYLNPTNEFELQEVLHHQSAEGATHMQRIAPIASEVILFTAVSAGIGTSTIALNAAQESAAKGVSTLLLDCNTRFPAIARLLGAQRIDRDIQASRFGFSIAEPRNLEALTEFTAEAGNFQRVIIDLGALSRSEKNPRGNRISDVISSWAFQSARHTYVLTRFNEYSIAETVERTDEGNHGSFNSQYSIGVMLSASVGRRERSSIASTISEKSGGSVSLFSRDYRSLMKSEREESTLACSAPHSVLRDEINSQLFPSDKSVAKKSR